MAEAALSLLNQESIQNIRQTVNKIKDGQTEEMVFALCGAVGSISSTLVSAFQNVLTSCNYTSSVIKVSNYIKRKKNVADAFLASSDYAKQIYLLQDGGNDLRRIYGNDILAKYIIQDIAAERKKHGESTGEMLPGEVKTIKRRHVTIIDSLKHDEELGLLRTVYGKMFYLFGVLSPEKVRLNRLSCDKSITPLDAASIIERDKGQSDKYGQKLTKTIHLADFFIATQDDNTEEVERQVKRYIGLLLGDVRITPTVGEYAMYIAQATALRSGCMSRQVGATIMSCDGDIVATGRNDVPRYSGGLYSCDDSPDNRCMFRTNSKCKNEEGRNKITSDIHGALRSAGIEDVVIADIFLKLESNRHLKGLVEYSKSIHAEMDAIVSAARTARGGLKGSSLYCTTYPCHNCARHIVAAGISFVYYIEPYEKSFASDLHDDSISVGHLQGVEVGKVNIVPFNGVSPRQYMSLFRVEERKKDGVLIPFIPTTAVPVMMRYVDPFAYYEALVVGDLAVIDSAKQGVRMAGAPITEVGN